MYYRLRKSKFFNKRIFAECVFFTAALNTSITQNPCASSLTLGGTTGEVHRSVIQKKEFLVNLIIPHPPVFYHNNYTENVEFRNL